MARALQRGAVKYIVWQVTPKTTNQIAAGSTVAARPAGPPSPTRGLSCRHRPNTPTLILDPLTTALSSSPSVRQRSARGAVIVGPALCTPACLLSPVKNFVFGPLRTQILVRNLIDFGSLLKNIKVNLWSKNEIWETLNEIVNHAVLETPNSLL